MDELTKIIKKRASNLRWRKSEKGYKTHRIDQWANKYKIIADHEKIYDIFINTSNCDYCKKELQSIQVKTVSKNSRCLDHCHTCGGVRGILCNSCNLKNKLKCEMCD